MLEVSADFKPGFQASHGSMQMFGDYCSRDLVLSYCCLFVWQQLYSSVEFGRRWQLVHEKVAPNRFYW